MEKTKNDLNIITVLGVYFIDILTKKYKWIPSSMDHKIWKAIKKVNRNNNNNNNKNSSDSDQNSITGTIGRVTLNELLSGTEKQKNEIINNMIIDEEKIDCEKIDGEIIDNEIIDSEIIDHENIDDEIIDSEIIENEIIECIYIYLYMHIMRLLISLVKFYYQKEKILI
ncbi:hypothetical protein C1645_778168 [Glomus cerebriforme]|uniref:Uncharacterized protein n=1 Tax=Glomus cerebriforme TaxID=658196 RepID=A0A397SLN3_9GLOM|nr:hypothetical protein C1645_778168 [Glomus cerebriforme]